MKTISIDIETYSGTDLGKCGVYKYTEDPDFEVLLFGYAVDGGEYGVYRFTLVCGGRTASFRLWNTNDWWRTSVILRMAPDGSGLEQVNCVMNNNPPFIETFFVPWTHPAE